jgi:hypothetical protein
MSGIEKTNDESRLQRSGWLLVALPRALPWAGMNDAFGVRNAPAAPVPSRPRRILSCAQLVQKALCGLDKFQAIGHDGHHYGRETLTQFSQRPGRSFTQRCQQNKPVFGFPSREGKAGMRFCPVR